MQDAVVALRMLLGKLRSPPVVVRPSLRPSLHPALLGDWAIGAGLSLNSGTATGSEGVQTAGPNVQGSGQGCRRIANHPH